LNAVFQSNRGDHSVAFEVLELEKFKKQVEVTTPLVLETDETTFDAAIELEPQEESEISVTTEVEETRIVTRLSMPSRKLKIKISNELLQELEKMQLNFKLN
jgi:DNA polymerase-3 subunit alpha